MKRKLLLSILIGFKLNFAFSQWQNLNLNQDILSTYKVGNTILAGTATGVYYKLETSTNWNLSAGISTKALSFTSDNNILYVSSTGKIYKSLDNGTSWLTMPTVYDFQDINNIAINGNNFIAGMNGSGIYFSANSGSEWWSAGSSWQSHNSGLVKKGNIYFASTENSGILQKSLDNTGQNWTYPFGNGIQIGLSGSIQNITTLSVLNDDILIAGTINYPTYSTYNGVYFSTDNGDNFTKRINGLTNTSINSIATTGNLIFAGSDGGGVFYSSDEGLNWIPLNTGLTNLTIRKLYSNQSSLYACTSTGLFKIDVCNLLQGSSKITPNGNITIANGNNIELKANLGGLNYVWYKDDVIIPGVNTFNYFATQSGNYKVSIEYSPFCSDISNTVNLTVQNLSIEENELYNKIKFYPNPVENELTIENKDLQISKITILDINGKLVYSSKEDKANIKINVSNLKNGIYFMKTNMNNNIKFIKK